MIKIFLVEIVKFRENIMIMKIAFLISMMHLMCMYSVDEIYSCENNNLGKNCFESNSNSSSYSLRINCSPSTAYSWVMSALEIENFKNFQNHLELSTNEQLDINLFFEAAAKNGYLGIIQSFVNQSDFPKPTFESINNAFVVASNEGFLTIMQFLILNFPLSLTYQSVNIAFANAAKDNNFSMMEWILKNPLKPLQHGVNLAFLVSAEANSLDTMKWIDESCSIKPDQETVNKAFLVAVRVNNMSMLEWLSQKSKISPNLMAREWALRLALSDGNAPIINWFLSTSDPENPELFNSLINQVVEEECFNILTFIFKFDLGSLRQKMVNQVFITAATLEKIEILSWLVKNNDYPDPEISNKFLLDSIKNNTLERIKKLCQSKVFFLDKNIIYFVFFSAIDTKREEIVQWLFDIEELRPNTKMINEIFSYYVKSEKVTSLYWPFSVSLATPDQETVNEVFWNVSKSKKIDSIKWLYQVSAVKPDINTLKQVLDWSASSCNLALMRWFCVNLTIQLEQQDVDKIFNSASHVGDLDVLAYIMSTDVPLGYLPSHDTLKQNYLYILQNPELSYVCTVKNIQKFFLNKLKLYKRP